MACVAHHQGFLCRPFSDPRYLLCCKRNLVRSSDTLRQVRSHSFLVMCVAVSQSSMHCLNQASPRARISSLSVPLDSGTAVGLASGDLVAFASDWASAIPGPTTSKTEQICRSVRITGRSPAFEG